MAAQTASNTATSASVTPVPYGPAEFADWQKDLRRAEIISFGALPFVTFASSIYYDIFRYYSHDQDEAYLPWPLKQADIAVPLSQAEQKNVFYASVGISLGVAAFDFAWHTIKRLKDRGLRDRREAEASAAIKITPIPAENSGE